MFLQSDWLFSSNASCQVAGKPAADKGVAIVGVPCFADTELKPTRVIKIMKLLTPILLTVALMLAFVAAPTNTAIACGGSGSCCNKEVQKEQTKNACCMSGKEGSSSCNKEKNCGGDCGKKGCHCPTIFSVTPMAVPTATKLVLLNFSPPKKAAWYYSNTIPNAVYLAIWLPPKISC
jgi:hypothetical protein